MVKFYTDHIKFHILIVICESENDVTARMVYRPRMFFLGHNFVSGLICTLKSKNLKKSLKTYKN